MSKTYVNVSKQTAYVGFHKMNQDTQASVFQLSSPPSTNINITIAGFVYFGNLSTKCTFGGISIIESISDNWKETVYLCNKGTHDVFLNILGDENFYTGNKS